METLIGGGRKLGVGERVDKTVTRFGGGGGVGELGGLLL